MGVRTGTVRRPPRGVPKKDYAKRDFYDLWLPQLAPSERLIRELRKEPDTIESWRTFEKRYVWELSSPDIGKALGPLGRYFKADGHVGWLLLRK